MQRRRQQEIEDQQHLQAEEEEQAFLHQTLEDFQQDFDSQDRQPGLLEAEFDNPEHTYIEEQDEDS